LELCRLGVGALKKAFGLLGRATTKFWSFLGIWVSSGVIPNLQVGVLLC